MASAAPATSVTMLVAAVLLVLLHSAMGHQQPPAHHSKGLQPAGRARHCPDHNEQPPPPTPTPPTPSPPPPPTPMPTPPAAAPPPALTPTTTPAPAPAPAVDCPAYCGKHCNQECLANMSAGAKKCETDYASNMSGCYDSCTANMCPGKCVDSGCSVDNCYTGCDNTYARSCCDECHRGLYPSYSSCVNYYNRADGYCIGKCTDDCYKKCTQG